MEQFKGRRWPWNVEACGFLCTTITCVFLCFWAVLGVSQDLVVSFAAAAFFCAYVKHGRGESVNSFKRNTRRMSERRGGGIDLLN